MKRRLVLVSGLVAVLLIGATLAFALWSASGSGSGSAKALTAQSLTVNAASGSADLYPGGPAGDVHFTITNPNPYAVTFTSMTPGSVSSGDATNCPAANVAASGAGGLSINVPANSTSGSLTIPGVLSMSSSAPDGCQGVSFTVALTLSGSQS